ncbi:hypothetical protein Misp01_79590 [Microtetraspora sp. NBRC 13810]|uniref:hypothetical protein n=1 Tax=Microtetraspora sp. NBRC 13810 TaxID=3030990 RepID=UPI0024A128D8|nr:hypothetical protein [Microtetraspora sp. NBRC 13810]GLW12831.1 hypothetical protein Misp01_79590 [Microtetraspora sp. NBRC 13810]
MSDEQHDHYAPAGPGAAAEEAAPGVEAPSLIPPAAIARLSPYKPNRHLTVVTPAVRTANRYLTDFLDSSSSTSDPEAEEAPGGQWKALLLLGEFGMGKTHLARDLAGRTLAARDQGVHTLLLTAPNSDLSDVYSGSLIDQFSPLDLFERVRDYYAFITADALESSEVASSITRGLREGSVDPDKVVAVFGLMESALRSDLRRMLRSVTESEQFATALALTLQPPFQNAVWNWLQGHEPAQILKDRGITNVLNTPASAVDALSVLAFMYGRANHRLVLVIDEFDKPLQAPPLPRLRFLQQFERLVNAFIDVGGLIIFCGPPDILPELPASLRERLRTLYLAPFDAGNTEECLGTGDSLSPFTHESAELITELTNGVPRQIIEVANQAQVIASESGTTVDRSVVHRAVRQQYEQIGVNELRALIRRILQVEGLHFEAGHRPDAGTDVEIEFWIPVGEQRTGIALWITPSLLEPADLDEIRRKAEAARRGAEHLEILLVVNGYLANPLREAVSGQIGRQPLVYDPGHFAEVLRNLVAGAVQRLEILSREDLLMVVRRQVARLSTQQSAVLTTLDTISGSVDRLDHAYFQRLTSIERGISALSVGAPRTLGPRADFPAASLPAGVELHFDRALSAIGSLTSVRDVYRDTFGTAVPSRGAVVPRRRLPTREVFEAVGVTVLLQNLLEAFMEQVDAWLQDAQKLGRVEGPQLDRLRLLCETYDDTLEGLPLFRLDSMAAFGAFSASPTTDEQSARTRRRAEAAAALDGLGSRVLDATLRAIAT